MAWALRDVRARAAALEVRLRGLEATLGQGPAAAARAATAPTLSPEAPPPATAAPPVNPFARPEPTPPTSAVPPVSTPSTQPGAASPAAAVNRPSLEERLGTRWTVWAGGLALAAGSLLLVKYSIDSGVFGPGVRVMLGGLLSLVLVGLGEAFRRSAFNLPIEALPRAHIPSILTATGTLAAFATIYAAHALYGFLGPAAAFVLLGVVGVATMAAAALHGPALAGLGLAAALITPALVTSPEPALWPVVLYLAVVAAAAHALARIRRWLWLAVAVVVGVSLWGVLFALEAGGSGGFGLAALAHVSIQMVLAAAFVALEPHLTTADADAVPDRIATRALFALTVVTAITLAATRSADAGWLLTATMIMAVLAATALRAAPAAGLAILSGLVVLAVAAAWPDVRGPADLRFLWPAVGEIVRVPDLQRSYLLTLAALALAVTAAATWRLLTSPALSVAVAGRYAVAAVATPIVVLAYGYLRVTQFDRSIWFGGLALLLAALFLVLTMRAAAVPAANPERAPEADPQRLALGAFAVGTMGGLALGAVMTLDRGYLTVALAVTAAAAAQIAWSLRIPALRPAIAALGLLILARVVIEPRIMGASAVGTWPIVNWLLLGYGVPALAFAFAGTWLKRTRVDLASQICDALAVIFTALLGVYQIRHALNGGDVLTPVTSHLEVGLTALLCILLADALNRIELRQRNPVFAAAVMVLGVLSAIGTFVGLLVLENPFFQPGQLVLGPPIASSLALAYLAPGLAAVAFARAARRLGQQLYMTLAAVLAIVLLFAYTTLETRHVFQGADIHWTRITGSAEMWAYSAVWLLLGLVLLGYGVVRGSFEARVASGVLVLLATLKAFLFDLAGLSGIWRPLSFLCLGAVLIGIGVVYQRLVFAPKPAPAGPPSTT